MTHGLRAVVPGVLAVATALTGAIFIVPGTVAELTGQSGLTTSGLPHMVTRGFDAWVGSHIPTRRRPGLGRAAVAGVTVPSS